LRNTKADLIRQLQETKLNERLFQETIWELEQEIAGWQVISSETNLELSRAGLDKIARECLIYWLRNPIIHRIPYIITSYVFGQGVHINSDTEILNETVQDFLNDKSNFKNFTSQNALIQKECELEIDGNVFFALFVEKRTGKCKVRTIPFAEIREIICNPDDRSEQWYYKRVWNKNTFDPQSGIVKQQTQENYYADIELYNKLDGKPIPSKYSDAFYIYHVKTNCLSTMLYGVPELYSVISWAKAYKEFLENWSAVAKSLARWAWKGNTPGGASAISNVKSKMQSKESTTNYSSVNPGAVAIGSKEFMLEAINKAGALPDPTGSRRLFLMICAGSGLYEHYFGDPSTGNLATAKSMERPMELLFRERQTFWRTVLLDILNFVIDRALEAPLGIKGARKDNATDEWILPIDEKTGEPAERNINVDFPDILEHDPVARIDAIVNGVTLKGSQNANTIPDPQYVTELILRALGEPESGKLAKELHEKKEPETGANKPPTMEMALKELTDTLKSIKING